MGYIFRDLEPVVARQIDRGRSVLLLGPRQTGKTTLVERMDTALTVRLIRPDVRVRYERDPGVLVQEIEALPRTSDRPPLVVLDEVQRVPVVLDVVQDLIDRRVAQFVLTGSSARKLRRGGEVNLLPGRVVSMRLDPLTLRESGPRGLEDCLLRGSLPALVSVADARDAEADLRSYATTYLEEEVRAEALVRNIGSFARFLELAASESGRITNFSKLSQELAIARATVSSYYEVLEDCLIVERVDPITASKTRKRLTRSHRYLFFDLGVRRLCARQGTRLSKETMGLLLEQWVGLELIRRSRLMNEPVRVHFWRDPNGPEVDWVVDRGGEYMPVEVKLTERPTRRDVRHVQLLLREYDEARHGYLVCTVPRRQRLDDDIVAIPWQDAGDLLSDRD